MRKIKILFFAGISLAIILSLFFFWQKKSKTPEASKIAPNQPLVMSKKDLNIPAGKIAEAIKQKNWSDFSHQFSDLKKITPELESMLSQVLFSLDSGYASENEHENIYKTLLPLIDQKDTLQPRGILLVSKVFGKLKLSEAEKKALENKYKKLGWIEKSAWLDVSIDWKPLPGSTLKALNGLLIKNRSDLLSDYFYNLNKISDKKILSQQLAYCKSKTKNFAQEQQRFISEQISQVERKIQTP